MQFPINLNLTGRACLVVGAGPIGLRKTEQLLAAGAEVTVVAPTFVEGFSRLRVRRVERPYQSGDVAGFRLVITATGRPEVDQTIYDEAEVLGIWVNSADDPERCAFTLPAVVRQGSVMVTFSTGGASPALSSWLRRRFEQLIGPEYAELAARLAAERARVHASGASTEDLDWQPIIERMAAELGLSVGTDDGQTRELAEVSTS